MGWIDEDGHFVCCGEIWWFERGVIEPEDLNRVYIVADENDPDGKELLWLALSWGVVWSSLGGGLTYLLQ